MWYNAIGKICVLGGFILMAKKPEYNNESMTLLKGPDKVRKRPAVIFGSDGLTAVSTRHLRSFQTQ